jgi:two-component sensor histidine kinase/CheY-like chemotaxis protein
MNKNADINISVLFVEDNVSILMLYAKMLQKRVAQVFTAENGQTGLDLYLQHKPDLILTDISMPVMNGLEMIKKIKEVQPDIKVVVMSAYSNNEYFLEAINLGVNGYLLKPVEVAKLYAIIKELADGILLKKELGQEEQKRHEGESNLKQLLAKKDHLLKEVHHSMKNNMQILSGVLETQKHLVKDEDVKAVLNEAKNRIYPIALFHELICRNDALADIKVVDYVKKIVENVAENYPALKVKVGLNYEIGDVRLSSKVAITCGLILNELVTNSFNYAFNGLDSGAISVKLLIADDNAYELQVDDNRKGVDNPDLLQDNVYVVINIVKNLLSEIDGELFYDYSDGAGFIVRFKV